MKWKIINLIDWIMTMMDTHHGTVENYLCRLQVRLMGKDSGPGLSDDFSVTKIKWW